MRLCILSLALLGCGSKDRTGIDEEDVPSGEVDEDGDGIPAPEDCDDADAGAFPGAAEACDGVDNDCDGDTDEGVAATFYGDADGDGYGDDAAAEEACELPAGASAVAGDCDDAAAGINPDAAEVCDDADNDCDGEADEDLGGTYYPDADGDGSGDEGSPWVGCDPPATYVLDGSDCDDTDPAVYAGAAEVCDEADNDCDGDTDEGVAAAWYADTDGDGFGVEGSIAESCDLPTGYAAVAGDCDDAEAGINPEAAEVCDDADNDCDGTTDEGSAADALAWYADTDADGFGDPAAAAAACDQPAGYVASDADCDDGDAGVNPAAVEVCGEVDDDCDGDIDEDAADAAEWYADGDGDGHGGDRYTLVACDQPAGYLAANTDCDDIDETAYDGAAEVCDEVDNDCDGDTDEGVTATFYLDADGDGHGAEDVTAESCDPPTGYAPAPSDCDDEDADVNPDAAEVCDGEDDDCDGDTDEGSAIDADTWYADLDDDGYGDAGSAEVTCDHPAGYVGNADDCDDGDASVNPSADEVCDEMDNDCDGDADDADGGVEGAPTWHLDDDSDGYGGSVAVARCDPPAGYVADDADCDDAEAAIHPGADELCNGGDDDCDGDADEDAVDPETFYADEDGDGYGDAANPVIACEQPDDAAADATDCDDGDAGAYPGAAEGWYDGVDADCDGSSDYDVDGDGYDSYAEAGGGDCYDADPALYACGLEAAAAVLTCETLLDLYGAAADGRYWLDPDGDGDPSDAAQVWCDQTRDGGGWAFAQWGAANASADLRTAAAVGALLSPGQSGSAKLSRAFQADLALAGRSELRYGHANYGYIYLTLESIDPSWIYPGYGSAGYGVPVAPHTAALSYGGTTYANSLFSWPSAGIPQSCTNTDGGAGECGAGLHLGTWAGAYPDGAYMNNSVTVAGSYANLYYEVWVK